MNMVNRFTAKYSAVIRMTWIQALEYKANSLVGTFAIISGVFIEYLLWKRIFLTRGVSVINGFTFGDLMVYIFLSLVVGQLKSSWITSLEMITAIREGELNKYLIRPISFFTYHFMLFIGYNSLFYLVYFFMIAGMIIFFPGWAFPSLLNIAGFLGTLIISVYLSYSVYFVMVCFAFWFGEVRALIIAYNLANMVLSGQMVPLRFFPDSVLKILRFTPLPYLVDLPVSIATGNLPVERWWTESLHSLFWSVAMTFIGLVVYREGIQRYEGFGG